MGQQPCAFIVTREVVLGCKKVDDACFRRSQVFHVLVTAPISLSLVNKMRGRTRLLRYSNVRT